MSIDNLSPAAAQGVAREFRNKQYEIAEAGAYFPKSRLYIGGHFTHSANGEPWSIDANLVVNEGLDYLLNAAFGGGAAVTQFFLAPFSGNVTPVATWTGANFAANATEFTAYANATRPQWVEANATAQTISNAASQAEFVFSAGGPYNLYGMALLSSNVKGGTAGILVAATRFATPRLGQLAGDRLAVQYTLTAADNGV